MNKTDTKTLFNVIDSFSPLTFINAQPNLEKRLSFANRLVDFIVLSCTLSHSLLTIFPVPNEIAKSLEKTGQVGNFSYQVVDPFFLPPALLFI
ncbi:hypothetical protein L7750_15790 [Xenorhabdus bovienii]|uniref:hypothetical protein n=1 Tax=Xenorhabdus bovienii TaxID=40576 RepID=UPI000B2D78E0|nr:hypothetical protein [Xenorhabdus bovienii]MCG3471797.1 hypothetical protein [Xenorhabdus bovienii]